MNVEHKLIIGLGELLKTPASVDAVVPPIDTSSYAAVHIGSSKESQLAVNQVFLGQHHCVDMRRQLLKQLLPFLSGHHSVDQTAAFSSIDLSRRYARLLYSQHQDWAWSTIAAALREQDMEPAYIIMMIDMSDSFASAVWVDCLFGLKQRYPQAEIYPIFLLPNMANLSLEEAAVIGAAVTELSQLSQGKWTPTDINTGADYPCTEPLWSVAYLQQCHQVRNDATYLQLVDAVLTLSNVEHNDYGTLRQSLMQEYYKILKPNSAKSSKLLPRFASMLQASLGFDVEALKGLLTQQCQSKLLASFTNTAITTSAQALDIETLETMGCVLNHEQLCLNEDTLAHKVGNWDDIETTWQKIFTQTVAQAEKQGKNWHEQAEFLATQLRKAYDKDFRNEGAEKYYHLQEKRLEQIAQTYVDHIEKQLWQHWQKGNYSLHDLQSAVETLVIHYVQLHQNYLMNQESNIDAIKMTASWWEGISSQWQQGNKKAQLQLAYDYPLATVAQKMGRLFVERCHYKAHLFAEKLILTMQPYLLDLQQQLSAASEAWLAQATQVQQQLNHMLDEQQSNWLNQATDAMHCRYLLQPNKASLRVLSEQIRIAVRDIAPKLNCHFVKRLQKATGFDGLIAFIESKRWQEDVEQSAQSAAKSILQTENEALQQILEQRITELDQQQIQYLGKFALRNLARQFHSLIQPLGIMLTTQYSVNETACLLCADNIKQHELIASWLANSAQQSLPRAKVMSLPGSSGAQLLYASTCYLDEWVELPSFLHAYRQFNHDEAALLHLHIDGSNQAISIMQKNSINRNRELIRQHLLLAYASGRLSPQNDCYQLQIADQVNVLEFSADSLADVVDYISFNDIQALVNEHEHMQGEETFIKNAETITAQLEHVLDEIKAESLPEGVDLDDADWSDAGRYVVWSRAAQSIRKQWLKNNGRKSNQQVA